MSKYKYLCYVPAPVKLEKSQYDLVDDEEFCNGDGRIPLLMVIQFGICAPRRPGKPDYSQLEGLENQHVGFIGRGYLSDRERDGIIEIFLDAETLRQIRARTVLIDLYLWDWNIPKH